MHPRHDSRFASHAIYADGLAVGSCDISTGYWYFRWYDESFKVKNVAIKEDKRLRYGFVAQIEQVRKANETL